MKKVFKSKAYKDKLKGHKDGLLKVFSPDGPESGMLMSASKDGCIRVWDLVERKITTKLLLSRESLEQPSQGDYLENNNGDQFGDDDDEQPQSSSAKEQKWMSALCFSKTSVFGGYEDGAICSWNIKSGELQGVFKGHTKSVTELEMLNATRLASASLDGTIRIWDTQTELNETIFHLPGAVDLMRITKNNVIQAVVNKDTFVEINTSTSKVIKSVRFMSTSITSFISVDNQLIIATTDNVIEVYVLDTLDQSNLQPSYIVENNKDWVLCMKQLGNYLYTGGDDRRIKVWDLSNKLTLVEELIGHDDGVVCIDFADSMLYSGSFDHSIRSWNLAEMDSRIQERELMFREDIWSRKYDAWYKVIYKKKKKGKKGGKK